MIKRHIKKGSSKAMEAAKIAARQVGKELLEIPKQTVKEAVGKKDSGISPVVEAMQLKTEKGEPEMAQSKDDSEKKLDYLEKELEELRRKREHEEYQKGLSEKQEALEKGKRPQIFKEPQAKKKMGLPSFGKKKTKGTGELIKSKK